MKKNKWNKKVKKPPQKNSKWTQRDPKPQRDTKEHYVMKKGPQKDTKQPQRDSIKPQTDDKWLQKKAKWPQRDTKWLQRHTKLQQRHTKRGKTTTETCKTTTKGHKTNTETKNGKRFKMNHGWMNACLCGCFHKDGTALLFAAVWFKFLLSCFLLTISPYCSQSRCNLSLDPRRGWKRHWRVDRWFCISPENLPQRLSTLKTWLVSSAYALVISLT